MLSPETYKRFLMSVPKDSVTDLVVQIYVPMFFDNGKILHMSEWAK